MVRMCGADASDGAWNSACRRAACRRFWRRQTGGKIGLGMLVERWTVRRRRTMARIACLVAGGVYMVRVESGSAVVRVGETSLVRETWRVGTSSGRLGVVYAHDG